MTMILMRSLMMDMSTDLIQGQFGGLSLPEVEEDAWSVKDYIE